jgi:hypothetical protein
MTTYTPKTFTLVLPDLTTAFPPNGNPPDGYVLTFDGTNLWFFPRPPPRIKMITTPSTSPYTVNVEDVVEVQNHSGTFTVNLPAAPLVGTTYFIKDAGGVAGTSPINVTPAGGQSIDGVSPSYVINNNFGCIQIVFNGSNSWSVLSKM